MKIAHFTFMLFTCLCVASAVYAQDKREDLANIQELINQTKNQLQTSLADSERLQQELKLAELEIAETATILHQTDRDLVQTGRDITALDVERTTLERSIEQQKNQLANQLKSAYMAGDYDYAKMLFNQQNAATFERVLTYYQYLNQARIGQIDNFNNLVNELQQVVARLETKRQSLANLSRVQQEQRQTLTRQQDTRIAKLRELNQQIDTDQERVKRLEMQEKNLVAAIEQAELAFERARRQADVEVSLVGLSGEQGRLIKPTNGRMQALFGKRRQGQVRWKGVVFNSAAGSPVSSVADGKVLYADWLKGFGLVLIVDHGEGYMSVYGRNQALLKQVGDPVQRGDTISLVGNSGSQNDSGLYFEIRHKGKALNPTRWLSRG